MNKKIFQSGVIELQKVLKSISKEIKDRKISKEQRLERERKIKKTSLLSEERKNYLYLIDEFNNIFSFHGTDIINKTDDLCEYYPIATTLIGKVQSGDEIPTEDDFKLYNCLSNRIISRCDEVKMRFTDYDNDYKDLLFWGDEFLEMNDIDLLYMTYLMLESQLHSDIANLDGFFEKEIMTIFLPGMAFKMQHSYDTQYTITNINCKIHGIGDLNALARSRILK